MITLVLSILLTLTQATPTGTIVGVVKLPGKAKAAQSARVVLLTPKYTEVWNKQVQTRLDNYWEIFKPDFAVNKEHFLDYERIAQIEALRYVTSNMRRELGDAASKFIKDASPNGQFEFANLPFGTYQLLVQAAGNGQDVIWSKPVEVQTDIPIFVDLDKPVS